MESSVLARLRKFWGWLWSPYTGLPLAAVLVAGGIGGVLFWGAFNTAMEMTNSLEFCISCHEMRDNVYQEYKQTVHFKNASGVRAICSDCHVPKDWVHKVVRKIQASNELFHKVIGTIDTKEKFEAHRLTMAQRVWDTMKATDSRECRNCHSFTAMHFEKQRPEAAKRMQKAMADGDTCIDCHKGIAHKMPDMTSGFKSMWSDIVASASALSPQPGDTYYTLTTIGFTAEKAGEGGRAAGRLLAATPVEVLERDGDQLKVRATGWRQENVDRVVYARAGKRIFVAALSPAATDLVSSGASQTDADTGQVWSEATMDVWIPARDLTDNVEPLWAYGAELYGATCATCHTAPAANHFVANQWIGTLNSMKQNISIDTEQYRFLQKYLQMHAADIAGH
ncbi:pentaheme c-type cytochrome TorC [Rhodobium orientis]|uniref:Cytochrome c-type protein n=1 Tax=Rhodobium orientis TaxID=34017 RepID=A0A327JKR2_9HYPH|nr:pentaheme c-type cytochrome TorC [Rhodobium orientis]MBK5952327.1 cytochrome C [Rhodobium orientis]RAI25422.1 pentaheme c-type cytochrome TorC [Rhodobium orientis]